MAATAAPAANQRLWIAQSPFYLTAAAAVATEISIAAFQILMGFALVAVVAARTKFRFPPVALPLAAWIVWTLISAAAHSDLERGLPQIKKFYVYLMLFLVVSAVRGMRQIRAVVLGWALAASASAILSLEQFARKYEAARAAHMNFYAAYVASRITGFMDHWMTFSGQMMLAVLLMLAFLLFSRDRRAAAWLIPALCLAAAALVAAETRSMWGAAAAGAAYLVWLKRRWLILAFPLALAVGLVANPFMLRERIVSIVRPHGDMDSNEHRALLRRVGWQMIQAHPLLGLGPEQVGPNFARYLPPDAPHPLPTGYYAHLHNIYFHYAAERGLPALAALLWFFGRALYDFARALARLSPDSEARWLLRGAVAAIAAFMLAGYFEVNWGDSEVLGMFLALVGCGYAAIESAA
ncbi:MAG TPA: O-antigen ligase family protein [Bryobacteraceae bacterium]|nr:O-antigen ligase family protein [Bryobacteraceae bacterium]